MINDAARAAIFALQLIAATHKFIDANAHRTGDQTADIHFRPGPEEHAIGVHQHHAAVGLDLAEDLTGFLIEDAIKRRGLSIGLLKLHLLVAADVETAPVNGGALTALFDGGQTVGGVMTDGRTAGPYLPTSGRCEHGCGGQAGKHTRQPSALYSAHQQLVAKGRGQRAGVAIGNVLGHGHAVAPAPAFIAECPWPMKG